MIQGYKCFDISWWVEKIVHIVFKIPRGKGVNKNLKESGIIQETVWFKWSSSMDEVWIESGEVSMDKSAFRTFPNYIQTVLKIEKVWTQYGYTECNIIHERAEKCRYQARC